MYLGFSERRLIRSWLINVYPLSGYVKNILAVTQSSNGPYVSEQSCMAANISGIQVGVVSIPVGTSCSICMPLLNSS